MTARECLGASVVLVGIALAMGGSLTLPLFGRWTAECWYHFGVGALGFLVAVAGAAIAEGRRGQ